MHAVARLALHPHIPNIQTSWVKMGPEGAAACLNAGAGRSRRHTDEREHFSRCRDRARAGISARGDGGPHPVASGGTPEQRTTLYRPVPAERREASLNAADLAPVVLTPPRRLVAAE